MFENLFAVFDLPLVCILIMLSFFGIMFIKNIYNIFLSLFIGIFLIIFIAATMLVQQIYLGEFLVISLFFMLTIIFFVFNLNNNYDDSGILETKKSKMKIFVSVIGFMLTFSIIGLNFERINTSKNKIIVKNMMLQDDLNVSATNNVNEREYNSYLENISLLNQNKVFQKLTHIVMFYVCLVVVLYFFNRKSNSDEKDFEEKQDLDISGGV